MSDNAVERCGKLVVTSFRDRAIQFFDLLSQRNWKSPSLQALQSELDRLTPEQKLLVRKCVTSTIDHGLHDFLFALQESHDLGRGIEVVVDGQNIAKLSDGLHGELFSTNGWIAKFGKYAEDGRHTGDSS